MGSCNNIFNWYYNLFPFHMISSNNFFHFDMIFYFVLKNMRDHSCIFHDENSLHVRGNPLLVCLRFEALLVEKNGNQWYFECLIFVTWYFTSVWNINYRSDALKTGNYLMFILCRFPFNPSHVDISFCFSRWPTRHGNIMAYCKTYSKQTREI